MIPFALLLAALVLHGISERRAVNRLITLSARVAAPSCDRARSIQERRELLEFMAERPRSSWLPLWVTRRREDVSQAQPIRRGLV